MMILQGPNVIKGIEVPTASKSGSVALDVRWAPNKSEESNGSVMSSSCALVSMGTRRSIWLEVDGHETNIHRTWQVPSFLTLTVPPTWDPLGSRFACVVNSNKVLLWDGQETKLDKVEPSLVLKEAEVNDILQEEQSGDLIFVFADGTAQSLKYLEKHGKSSTVSTLLGAKLKKTLLLRQKNHQPCLVHLIESKTGSQELLAHGMFVNPELGQLETTQLDSCSVSKGERLLGLVQVAEGPAMLVMTSTGRLFCRHLLTKNHTDPTERKIDGLPLLTGGEDILVASIDEEYAVLAFSSKLYVINLKFYSLIHSLDLENQPITALTILNKKLFLATKENVQLVNPSSLPRSLDGLLGLLEGKNSSGMSKNDNGTATKSKVDQMIPVNSVSSSVKLYTTIPKMFQKGDVDSLEKLLLSNKAEEVPELLMLASVEYLLKCPNSALAKSEDSAQVRREKLIRACLNAPMTEPLMVQYAAKLDSTLAIQVLEYLDLSLRIMVLQIDGEGEDGVDFFSRLLNWVAVLLNTHYSSFVIAKDAKVAELMTSLTETIGTCTENMYFDMVQLMPLLKMMQEGTINSNDSKLSRRDYCIEMVNL